MILNDVHMLGLKYRSDQGSYVPQPFLWDKDFIVTGVQIVDDKSLRAATKILANILTQVRCELELWVITLFWDISLTFSRDQIS